LKPENVLIDRDGYIKLTDFGLSKIGVVGNEGAKSRCGTPEYLAPEILLGNHGKAADWWTVGAIIYEMVSGIPPYYGDSREELFLKI
jgi:serum/glucocorticoid-regulated kinase 2